MDETRVKDDAEAKVEVLHKEEAPKEEKVEEAEGDEADAKGEDTKETEPKEEEDDAELKEEPEEEAQVEEEEEEEPRRTRPKRKAAEKSAIVMKKSKKEKEEKGKKSGASGFSKPVKVSEELADFLGQDEISRPQLTKFMWAYFKENGLQDPHDRRHIIADDKLKELLKVDRFNAFGFMKLVKPHLIG